MSDLVSLRDSLQRTVLTGGISEATQTTENSLLSTLVFFLPSQQTYGTTPFACKHISHSGKCTVTVKTLWVESRAARAAEVKNPGMDIWDGGRETEKGTHLDRD